jgi:hypothetical protein
MKFTRHIFIVLMVFLTHLFANSFGYLRQVEASFCMDDCSQHMLEEENGSFTTFLANTNDIELSYYINRYIEIVSGGEYQCIECSAMIIESIQISDACNYPVACFADPCEVANECQLNTPVECVSNYCDGCYADFYDMDGNLVDCYNTPDCTDLSEIFFGECDMFIGYGYANGLCQGISGCGWVVDGVDYSDAFFNSMGECEEACTDVSEPTCDEIEDQYSSLHSGTYSSCYEDSDCISIWGDCDVGLGGCHYSVNNNLFDYEYSDDLVDMWVNGDCMQWVCDCMPLPNSICTAGECELTYCDGPNPAGCFDSGCQDGYECIDFGNSGYADFCVASSCFCDEDFIYQTYWTCTEDCNGGTCVPEAPQPGDLCIFEEMDLNIPGFVDCNGQCMDYIYHEWVGDGWCDDGWGYSFNCEALDFDGGDCVNNCNSGDVNADGTLNILDIVLMVECILNANDTCNCSDLNQDGQVNVMDVIILVNMIIGL